MSAPPTSRRVLLLTHTGRAEARSVARSFIAGLTAHGVVVRLLAAVVTRKVGREVHHDGRRRRATHARGVQRAERRLGEACPRQEARPPHV